MNVFKMFDWFMKEGWPRIPRKRSKKDAIEETNSSNTTNEISKRKLFKLFFQSHERIKTDISLKLPLNTIALILNVP